MSAPSIPTHRHYPVTQSRNHTIEGVLQPNNATAKPNAPSVRRTTLENWKGKLKELALEENGTSSAGPRFGDDYREQLHLPVDSEKISCFSSLLSSAARHRRGEPLCALSTFLLDHFSRQGQIRIVNALPTRPDDYTLPVNGISGQQRPKSVNEWANLYL